MPTCILVHGTFAPNAAWTRAGSGFRSELSRQFGGADGELRFQCPQWSGWNLLGSRINAAKTIAKTVEKLRRSDPTEALFLVGHSHGGNALVYFAKRYPPLAAQVRGFAFLSTPFVALRIKRTIAKTLDSLLFFAFLQIVCAIGLLLYWQPFQSTLGELKSQRLWTWSTFTGVLDQLVSSRFVVFLVLGIVWLPKVVRPTSKWLLMHLERTIAAHVASRQTIDFARDNALFLHMAGDEATLALSFAQACGMAVQAIEVFLRLLADGVRRFTDSIVVERGRWVFTIICGLVALMPPDFLDAFYNSFYGAVTLGGIMGMVLGTLFIVALLVVLVLQNMVLLSFGWLNAIDAVFCDVAVGIAPYGCERLVSLDWSYSARQSDFSLSHSGSYTNEVAIKAIAAWMKITRDESPAHRTDLAPANPREESIRPRVSLQRVVGTIDWKLGAYALLSGLKSAPYAAKFAVAAKLPEIQALSRSHGIDPNALLLGMLARASWGTNRAARDVAWRLLTGIQPDLISHIMNELDLREEEKTSWWSSVGSFLRNLGE